MAFTTSGHCQETEWALFLQPWSPHGASRGRAVVPIHPCENNEQ